MIRAASNDDAYNMVTQVQKSIANSDVVRQFADIQKRIDANGVTMQFDEIQKNLASSEFAKQIADVQKQIDANGFVKRLNEVQKSLGNNGFVKQLADVQKQIDANGFVKRLNEVQKSLGNNGFVKQLADVQKQIEASSIVQRLGAFRTQLADTDAASVYSALGNLSESVREDRDRWNQIEHSFDNLNTQKDESQVSPIRTPAFAERFERSLNARSKFDHDALGQQSALLASIAEAGKKQNETMAEIAKLQNMLVEEALQNTRIQRTFLYFSALSAALALFALIIK